jgi:hypothetical protein
MLGVGAATLTLTSMVIVIVMLSSMVSVRVGAWPSKCHVALLGTGNKPSNHTCIYIPATLGALLL